MVKVGRGDTLAGIIVKVGADPDQAKAIVEAFAPVFPLQNLKPGQQVRFNLVPAPSDTEEMEPVNVSVYAGNKHLATVARTNRGDFIVTDQKGASPPKAPSNSSAPRSIRASITQPKPSAFRPTPSSSCSASIPTTSTSSRR